MTCDFLTACSRPIKVELPTALQYRVIAQTDRQTNRRTDRQPSEVLYHTTITSPAVLVFETLVKVI